MHDLIEIDTKQVGPTPESNSILKRFWVQKSARSQKIVVLKKNFSPKEVLGFKKKSKKCGSKNFWVLKNFWLKKILGQKEIWGPEKV